MNVTQPESESVTEQSSRGKQLPTIYINSSTDRKSTPIQVTMPLLIVPPPPPSPPYKKKCLLSGLVAQPLSGALNSLKKGTRHATT